MLFTYIYEMLIAMLRLLYLAIFLSFIFLFFPACIASRSIKDPGSVESSVPLPQDPHFNDIKSKSVSLLLVSAILT